MQGQHHDVVLKPGRHQIFNPLESFDFIGVKVLQVITWARERLTAGQKSTDNV